MEHDHVMLKLKFLKFSSNNQQTKITPGFCSISEQLFDLLDENLIHARSHFSASSLNPGVR